MQFLLGGLAVLIIIIVFFGVFGGMALIGGMVTGNWLRKRNKGNS